MSKREPIKTTIKEIVDYWAIQIEECELSVDWADAHERCWRCGCKAGLERCHIVPDSLGGKDEPANFVLLCKRCHADGPNVEDPEIMWDWLNAYKVSFYDSFWTIVGQKEYEFIYGQSFNNDLKRIRESSTKVKDKKDILELEKEKLLHAMEKTGIHFGQPYFNTATVAGVLRMMLKDIANELEVDFPFKDKQENQKQPWWVKHVFN